MRWIPFVTFLQVSADMAVSVGVPDGHGHNYILEVTLDGEPDPWFEFDKAAVDTRQFVPIKVIS